MEKRQWKLVFWHHEIVVREKVDRIVQGFRLFEGIGSAIASLDPVHAGIPWAGVCALLQLVTNDSDQHGRLLDGLVFITDLVNFYIEAESFYLSQEVQRKPFVDLYTLILEFQMLAAGYFAQNTAKRVARNVLLLDSWPEKLTGIEKKDMECRKRIDLTMSKQIMKKLDAQSSRLNEDATHAQTILQWISRVSVKDQHVFVRESKLGRAYWNTGRWLVGSQEWNDWIHGTSGIFYLEGGVGVGKSCLVSAVIEEHFRATLGRLAFFYCSKSVGGSFDAKTILRSILAQLSYSPSASAITSSIRKRYDERLSNVNGGDLSLRDCEDHILELTSQNRPTTIIIDALDECADNGTLLGSLKRIYSESSNVHLFFSSRPMHLKVMDYLEEFSPTTITVIDQSKDEMLAFIENEIRSPNRRLNSCINQLPELESKLRDALVQRAGAMFRWAELQLDLFLNAQKPIRHWRDFEAKLNRLVSDLSLPTLTQAYDEIYLSNAEPGSFAETCAIKALRCVLGAFQPLTIHQLVEAVAVEPDGASDASIDAAYIMDVCGNFVLVDESGSVVLAHLSVREYLEQRRSSDNGDFQVFASAETHRQLAESCLATVLHTDFANLDAFPDHEPWLHYAIAFWPAHCERIPEAREAGALRDLLMAMMEVDALGAWAEGGHKSSYWWQVDRLRDMPVKNPSPYVVCAWGLVEFASDMVKVTEPLDNSYKTPLEVASLHGQLAVVQWILESQRGEAYIPHKIVTRALVAACTQGHISVANLLLDAGADPTPALLCRFAEDFDHVAQLLIDRGANIDARPSGYSLESGTALETASMDGHVRIARALLTAGADPNISDSISGCALQRASAGGHMGVVELLLAHGANVDLHDGLLHCPLLAAAGTRKYDIVRFLLAHGADPNPGPDAPATPLEEVLQSAPVSMEMVQLLVRAGANVNTHHYMFGSPLRTAIIQGEVEVARFLLDNGAHVNPIAAEDESPLVTAAYFGDSNMVQLLLQKGADVDRCGSKACQEADSNGHAHILELLVKHGAQISRQQDDCNSFTEVGE
ncbi:ankyrin repeat-containing domain protein [Aspergillus pseudodeflectus]|uniref:Ankyrin repeat-containing domain protein n=1 Tax=Aspergillus pseudodeflectus TaxID=176178 RepID=A0ABR4JPY6_9EURO